MRELILGQVSSRDEFHLGVWSFGFWCLHDPGVKFAHPGIKNPFKHLILFCPGPK